MWPLEINNKSNAEENYVKNVVDLQYMLKILGYYQTFVDGDFGLGTEAAVKNFQRNKKLAQTGKVDETLFLEIKGKFNERIKERPPFVYLYGFDISYPSYSEMVQIKKACEYYGQSFILIPEPNANGSPSVRLSKMKEGEFYKVLEKYFGEGRSLENSEYNIFVNTHGSGADGWHSNYLGQKYSVDASKIIRGVEKYGNCTGYIDGSCHSGSVVYSFKNHFSESKKMLEYNGKFSFFGTSDIPLKTYESPSFERWLPEIARKKTPFTFENLKYLYQGTKSETLFREQFTGNTTSVERVFKVDEDFSEMVELGYENHEIKLWWVYKHLFDEGMHKKFYDLYNSSETLKQYVNRNEFVSIMKMNSADDKEISAKLKSLKQTINYGDALALGDFLYDQLNPEKNNIFLFLRNSSDFAELLKISNAEKRKANILELTKKSDERWIGGNFCNNFEDICESFINAPDGKDFLKTIVTNVSKNYFYAFAENLPEIKKVCLERGVFTELEIKDIIREAVFDAADTKVNFNVSDIANYIEYFSEDEILALLNKSLLNLQSMQTGVWFTPEVQFIDTYPVWSKKLQHENSKEFFTRVLDRVIAADDMSYIVGNLDKMENALKDGMVDDEEVYIRCPLQAIYDKNGFDYYDPIIQNDPKLWKDKIVYREGDNFEKFYLENINYRLGYSYFGRNFISSVLVSHPEYLLGNMSENNKERAMEILAIVFYIQYNENEMIYHLSDTEIKGSSFVRPSEQLETMYTNLINVCGKSDAEKIIIDIMDRVVCLYEDSNLEYEVPKEKFIDEMEKFLDKHGIEYDLGKSPSYTDEVWRIYRSYTKESRSDISYEVESSLLKKITDKLFNELGSDTKISCEQNGSYEYDYLTVNDIKIPLILDNKIPSGEIKPPRSK